MPPRKSDSWSDSTGLARAILYDRTARRKWLAWMAMVPLAMLAIGLWVIDRWIWENPWHVLIWWGGCAVATCVVMAFALYDALTVIREERGKVERDVEKR